MASVCTETPRFLAVSRGRILDRLLVFGTSPDDFGATVTVAAIVLGSAAHSSFDLI
jgi:hypothetical protein